MSTTCLYAFALSAAVGTVLPAAPGAPSQTQDILDRLDAADYEHRQAATVALLTLRTLADNDLVALYTAAETPEQRHRLLTSARHHLLRRLHGQDAASHRGSLGIRHKLVDAKRLPHLGQPAFHVDYTLPGFPAHEVLLRGDLILALDGRRFEQHIEALSNRVISKTPGQTIRLTVLRAGKTIVVPVRLAGREALERMYPKARQQGQTATQPVLAEPYRRQWIQLREKLVALGPPVKTLPIKLAGPSRLGNNPSQRAGDKPDQLPSTVRIPVAVTNVGQEAPDGSGSPK